MGKILSTKCGELEGTSCELAGVTAYKGIRYATAERWQYPKQVTHWEGIYDATEYGNCCYQPRAFYNEAENPDKAFYYNEFRRDEEYSYSEDCLFLNIWAPDNRENLPVIFYIHGGSYTGGCGHEKHFDGPVWAAKGVVAVTINYRLGPLGFLSLPELKEESDHSGNYGLYDQWVALRWVRDNIEAFGGDPDQITVMGQSAGAMSIQALCLSPMVQGLFRGAVMSSGCGVNSILGIKTREEARYDFWKKVMAEANCNSIEEFRNLPAEELFAAWDRAKVGTSEMANCSPCIDGRLIVDSSVAMLKQGTQHKIPYMVGTNSEDIVPAFFFLMAKNWCKKLAKKGQKDCYAYYFGRQLPGDKKGAWHSADLWYWFGTLKNGWRPFTEEDEALSEEMVEDLITFARGMAPWEAWSEKGRHKIYGEGPSHMGKPSFLKLVKTTLHSSSAGE